MPTQYDYLRYPSAQRLWVTKNKLHYQYLFSEFSKMFQTITFRPLINCHFYICTSNHMFKREIWDKFTEFTFLKFQISKYQKMNEVNFPKFYE